MCHGVWNAAQKPGTVLGTQERTKKQLMGYPWKITCYAASVLYRKSGHALEQAAQGSGRVTIPGGVQKTCRYGTTGHSLVGMVVLDLMILEVYSNLYDSIILWSAASCSNPAWGLPVSMHSFVQNMTSKTWQWWCDKRSKWMAELTVVTDQRELAGNQNDAG